MIENMQIYHADRVADIHIEAFPDSFLTQLGKQFLVMLYQEFPKSGFGYVYTLEHDIAGFLAGIFVSADEFYNKFIGQHIIRLAPTVMGSIVRRPSILLPVLQRGNRLFLDNKPQLTIIEPEYESIMQSGGVIATALTMAVSHQYRGKGIAKQLWSHLLCDLPSRGVEAIIGSVQFENIATNSLYEKMGFKLAARIKRNYVDEEYKWLFYRRGYCSVNENGHVSWHTNIP